MLLACVCGSESTKLSLMWRWSEQQTVFPYFDFLPHTFSFSIYLPSPTPYYQTTLPISLSCCQLLHILNPFSHSLLPGYDPHSLLHSTHQPKAFPIPSSPLLLPILHYITFPTPCTPLLLPLKYFRLP